MTDGMDERLHRELRALPARRAPADLLTRIMAQAAARSERPWYRRAWWTWPAPARWAFVLTVSLAGALALAALLGIGTAGLAALSAAQTLAGAAWVVARSLWAAGGQPLQVLAAAMLGSCAAFGAGLAWLTCDIAGRGRIHMEAA